MKRIFALFLTLGLLFETTVAIAEEFSLHNGITFGDTMDEVLEKETFAIKSIDDGSDEDSDKDEESNFSIITETDTLAGVFGSYIEYRFNEDKVLIEAIYHFPAVSFLATYDEINSVLVKKYGEPLGYSNGKRYIITGNTLFQAVFFTELAPLTGGHGEITDYDEWDVDTGDYHVKVEHVEYNFGRSLSETENYHDVGYKYFTDEELQNRQTERKNAEKEREKERTEKQNAMDNDL